ncbi:PilZ domain-containing protein [Erythrobacter sp. W53]|uniref:PilZ domain-containing protein n=1 Tax=Erythrobacter sp. W53 TaxID=3425947 RepID=UPI003D769C30
MKTRQKPRKAFTLPGRYFTGLGAPVDVMLTDLSEGGCRFVTGGRALPLGANLQIYVANSGPHLASVKWAAQGEVGVTFSSPLATEKFEQFQNSHVPDASWSEQIGEFDAMPEGPPRRFC